MSTNLKDLLARGADDAAAIAAPGRHTLSHGALRRLIETTLARLNGLGLGRNDRVAIVLDNGPEMATCFMACATVQPSWTSPTIASTMARVLFCCQILRPIAMPLPPACREFQTSLKTDSRVSDFSPPRITMGTGHPSTTLWKLSGSPV